MAKMVINTNFVKNIDTQIFSSLMHELSSENHLLRPLVSSFPSEIDLDYLNIKALQNKIDRTNLVEVLEQQNSKKKSIISKLLDSKTFTICTAHQPILFLGPAFFIHKILYTIKLTNLYKAKFPEFEFIPLLYLGTEDDDWDEIGMVNTQTNKFQFQPNSKTISGSTILNKNVEEDWKKFVEDLNLPFDKLIYGEGKSLSEATIQLIDLLFSKSNLLVLDAHHQQFKKALIPLLKYDLLENNTRNCLELSLSLLKANFHVQAEPRETNFFYFKDNRRLKINRTENGFLIDQNISLTYDEMQFEIENHPDRFIPNVIYRPLYQESILPNISFVGGGGECAYWLQLKPLCDKLGVDFPVIILRQSIVSVIQVQFSNTFLELCRSKNEYVENIIQKHMEHKTIKNVEDNLQKAWDAYIQSSFHEFNLQENQLLHPQKQFREAIQGMQKNIKKQIVRLFEDKIKIFEEEKNIIFPNGEFQERVFSFFDLNRFKTLDEYHHFFEGILEVMSEKSEICILV